FGWPSAAFLRSRWPATGRLKKGIFSIGTNWQHCPIRSTNSTTLASANRTHRIVIDGIKLGTNVTGHGYVIDRSRTWPTVARRFPSSELPQGLESGSSISVG